MKPAIKFMALGIMVLGVSANAVSRPALGKVIAFQMADLSETTSGDAIKYPMVTTITKNVHQFSKKPVSFTLQEDTGIRCIMAPCPSQKTSFFRITDVERLNKITYNYKAIEILPQTKAIGPLARVLEVRESIGTEDEGTDLWEVSLTTFGQERTFEGYVSPVYSIQ